jgi:hypothetical protein
VRTFIEQAIGLVALGALIWFWLGLAESSTLILMASVVLFLLIIAGVVLLARRGLQQLTERWHIAWLLGFPVAWLLVKWVPGLQSFTGQAASMAVRFALAYLLFVVGWVTLLSWIPFGKPASTQDNTVVLP